VVWHLAMPRRNGLHPHTHSAPLGRFGCYFATGEDGGHTQATYAFYTIPVSCLVAAARNKEGTLHSFVHALTDGGSRRIPKLLGKLLQAKLGSVLVIAGGARAQSNCQPRTLHRKVDSVDACSQVL